MFKAKTLLPVGVLACAVLVGVFIAQSERLANARTSLGECKTSYVELQLAIEEANNRIQAEIQARERLQADRTRLIEEKAIRDSEVREELVKYVTKEVVRYVEAPVDRVVLPAEWVQLYNASGAGVPASTSAALSTGLLDVSASGVHNHTGGTGAGRRGAGSGHPEQPQLQIDPPAAVAVAGVGKESAR